MEKKGLLSLLLFWDEISSVCSWIAGHLVTDEDRRNFMFLRSEELFSVTFLSCVFVPKEWSFDSKVS